MIRSIRGLELALAVLVVALAGTLRAEETKCAGVITKIEGQIITVKAEDAEHELTLAPATKITLDNKPAQASDLKVGHKVKCVSDKQEKKSLCRSVDAMSSGDK